MNKLLTVIGVVIVVALGLLISLGLMFAIAWCFDYDLTWKMACGIQLGIIIINLTIKGFLRK